jgi:formate dehydrogenase subunit delta
MTTANEKVIEMANQIADFFRVYPPDQATAGIQDHITAYWTPRMRAEILSQAAKGNESIDALVLEAIRSLSSGESPIRKEVGGPEEVGQLGSDAG